MLKTMQASYCIASSSITLQLLVGWIALVESYLVPG